jgi:hypothetical protein
MTFTPNLSQRFDVNQVRVLWQRAASQDCKVVASSGVHLTEQLTTDKDLGLWASAESCPACGVILRDTTVLLFFCPRAE